MAFRVRCLQLSSLEQLAFTYGRRYYGDLGPFEGSGYSSGLGSYRYENHPIESPNRGKPILGSGHVLSVDFARTTVPGAFAGHQGAVSEIYHGSTLRLRHQHRTPATASRYRCTSPARRGSTRCFAHRLAGSRATRHLHLRQLSVGALRGTAHWLPVHGLHERRTTLGLRPRQRIHGVESIAALTADSLKIKPAAGRSRGPHEVRSTLPVCVGNVT